MNFNIVTMDNRRRDHEFVITARGYSFYVK